MPYNRFDSATWNQGKWTKYGYWSDTEGHSCPQRAIIGHFSTLRAWEAARVEYRYWDDPIVQRIEKMRDLPEPLRETNYWEGHFSLIKESRWNRARQTLIETPGKHRRLRERRTERLAREAQRNPRSDEI